MGRQAYATIPLATEMGDWRWETRERVVGRSVNDSFPDLMGLGSVLPRSGGTTGGTNGYFLPRSDGTIKKILSLSVEPPVGSLHSEAQDPPDLPSLTLEWVGLDFPTAAPTQYIDSQTNHQFLLYYQAFIILGC
jgi:hypothetical protein